MEKITTKQLLNKIINSLDEYSVAYNNGSEEQWITREEVEALWKDDDVFDDVRAVKKPGA